MKGLRLLIIAAMLAAVVAPATADARVKQRFEDIYKVHLTGTQKAGNLLVSGVTGSIAEMQALSGVCQDPNSLPYAEQAAKGAVITFQHTIDNYTPSRRSRFDQWFAQDRWYTKPAQDLKVVRRGRDKDGNGLINVVSAWHWLEGGFTNISHGNCDVTAAKDAAQAHGEAADNEIRAGIALLRSLLG